MSRLMFAILSLLLVALPGLAPQVAAQEGQPTLPTALAGEGPDRCERNETAQRACPLPLDAVSGPFTFVPDGDQDYFSVNLGEQPGLALEVTVRGTGGLDLRTTVSRADDGAALALIASPAISATLSHELVGWVVLRVENRTPGRAEGERYSIELRQVLPPDLPVAPRSADAALLPDRLENNWSPETAAPVGVGSIYDLSFVCPVAGGCAGGDHDYLAVPVKAGVEYLIATFDLGPGVDTVLDLFWGDSQTPAATSDDMYPGVAFLSALRWRAPGDGAALVRVGPRTGGVMPAVFDDRASSYRFAVVLAASDLARQIEGRIAQQAPSPTVAAPSPRSPSPPPPPPPAAPPPAPSPAAATPAADAPKGPAVVAADLTALRGEPREDGPLLQELRQGAEVELLGQAVGPWVRAQPADGVVPGWLYGPDLRRAAPAAPGDAPATGAPATGAPPSVAPATPTPSPALPRVRALPPDPPPPAPPAPVSRRVEVVVELVQGASAAGPQVGAPTATPEGQRPLAQVRVQLVTVFGDVLAEALTGADGRVGLSRDLPPGVAAYIRIPVLGVQTLVGDEQPVLRVSVPEGDAP